MSEIFGHLELPSDDAVVNQIFTLQGWVFSEDSNKVTTKIFIDNKLIYETYNGMPRFDIYQKYNSEKAYSSGFLGNLLLNGFQEGDYTITAISSFDNVEKIIGTKAIKLKIIPGLWTSLHFDNRINQRFNGEFPLVIRMNHDLCKLESDNKILEIGCQYGRNVLAFTKLLSKHGSFNGIDIIPDAIESCTKNITKRFPNFIFTLTPNYNTHYNPSGSIKSKEYVLPYDDESFDFVYLVSVFTHMLRSSVENYIKEISRVLKKGGRCLITYNLLNDNSIKVMSSGRPGKRDFPFEHDGCKIVSLNDPEGLTAHYESTIRKLYDKNNLTIIEPIQYGSWAWDDHIQAPLNNQDIIIATK